MEQEIKLAGKYDIQDGKLIPVDYETKLKTIIHYSEEMGQIYFKFYVVGKRLITKAVDVEPPLSLSLEEAWYSFRDDVVTALTETTWEDEESWEDDCPLGTLDRKFLEGTAEYFAEQIFRMRALEELDTIL